ncbi:hypothetical protein Hanom_Chr05g00450281 [Helianthus anomalus]
MSTTLEVDCRSERLSELNVSEDPGKKNYSRVSIACSYYQNFDPFESLSIGVVRVATIRMSGKFTCII